MNKTYRWNSDKSRYLWQERVTNIFTKRGWDSNSISDFVDKSEIIISLDEFTVFKTDMYHDMIVCINGNRFFNQPLFLQHEIEEYLEEVK